VSAPGPLDLQQVMRQARELGERVQRVQEALRHREVEATVGGGLVKAVMNGRLELVRVEIDARAIDPAEREMLQDLVAAAVNQALQRAQELAQQEMQRATGLPLAALSGALSGPREGT
jgi:hypothetical protein